MVNLIHLFVYPPIQPGLLLTHTIAPMEVAKRGPPW